MRFRDLTSGDEWTDRGRRMCMPLSGLGDELRQEAVDCGAIAGDAHGLRTVACQLRSLAVGEEAAMRTADRDSAGRRLWWHVRRVA